MKKLFLLLSAVVASSGAFAQEAVNAVAAEPVVAQAAGTPDIKLLWWIAPIASILALLAAFIFYKKMMKADAGSAKMQGRAFFAPKISSRFLV